jgi:hypothetical protein
VILSHKDFARRLSLVGYFAETSQGADAQALLSHDVAQRNEIERLKAYIVLLEPEKPRVPDASAPTTCPPGPV